MARSDFRVCDLLRGRAPGASRRCSPQRQALFRRSLDRGRRPAEQRAHHRDGESRGILVDRRPRRRGALRWRALHADSRVAADRPSSRAAGRQRREYVGGNGDGGIGAHFSRANGNYSRRTIGWFGNPRNRRRLGGPCVGRHRRRLERGGRRTDPKLSERRRSAVGRSSFKECRCAAADRKRRAPRL